MTRIEHGWHFTNGDRLRDGRPLPAIGEWLKHEGKVEMCESGLHYSPTILAALRYAPGCTLHRVSCRDVVAREDDKAVCRQRRIDASADMLWAIVCFADNCATRAAADAAADDAYAAAVAARYAAYAAATAADAAWRAAAWRAAAWRAAAWRAAADDDADAWRAERAWQEDTLQLWWECMSSNERRAEG